MILHVIVVNIQYRQLFTPEEQSKNKTNNKMTLSDICLVHPSKLFLFRGNPSITNLEFFEFVMARSIRLHVISTGTILPSCIDFSISSPYSESGLERSSRSKSPAEIWSNSNFYIKHNWYINEYINKTLLYFPNNFYIFYYLNYFYTSTKIP